MTARRHFVIAAIAILVVALMGGGIAAGANLSQQHEVAAEQAAQPAEQPALPAGEEAAPAKEAPPAQAAEQPPVEAAPVVKATRHSVIGRVVSASADRLTVRDGTQRLHEVQITRATVLRGQGRQIARDALAPGARVTAVGSPDANGVIVASLIAVEASPARPPLPRGTPHPDFRQRPFPAPMPRS